MDDTPASALTRLRWAVAAALGVIGITLARQLLVASAATALIVHILAVLAIALSTYAWVLYTPAASAIISAIVCLFLLWAWAVQQTAVLGVDLAAFGALVGVAAVQRRMRYHHVTHLQQVVDDLGEELTVKRQAIALASQTREALQKKLSRYQQLQSIAEELSHMTDSHSIAQLAVDRAFGLIGKSDVCLLFLVDKERQELSLVASKRRPSIASVHTKHGDQFDRYVLRTHRPLLVNDVRRDFRFTVTVSPDRAVTSVIACPLLLGQSPEGVLRLDSAAAGAYTQDDLRFLDILLDLVATAVTNAMLFARTQQLAMTDGLTGLTLRRPFLEHLTRELTRAARSHEPVSVLMLDIDRFKVYNDTFGHTTGDLILKEIAEILRAVVTPGASVARYGGEEFAVLLPRLNRPQASDVAQTIRRVVEQQVQGSGRHPASAGAVPRGPAVAEPSTRTTTVGRGLAQDSTRRTEPDELQPAVSGRVTVSIGIATFPEDAQAELELIRVADQRLYQAKRAGRNLVVCS